MDYHFSTSIYLYPDEEILGHHLALAGTCVGTNCVPDLLGNMVRHLQHGEFRVQLGPELGQRVAGSEQIPHELDKVVVLHKAVVLSQDCVQSGLKLGFLEFIEFVKC